MQIGFIGILTLIFLTLKLTSVIDWSWFWVLSPLIAGVVIWIIVMIMAASFILSIFGITRK